MIIILIDCSFVIIGILLIYFVKLIDKYLSNHFGDENLTFTREFKIILEGVILIIGCIINLIRTFFNLW